jgi:hypothetical protein
MGELTSHQVHGKLVGIEIQGGDTVMGYIETSCRCVNCQVVPIGSWTWDALNDGISGNRRREIGRYSGRQATDHAKDETTDTLAVK